MKLELARAVVGCLLLAVMAGAILVSAWLEWRGKRAAGSRREDQE
jgi:hypothetical protein